MSVTRPVINYGKSVTRSVMRCFIRLQTPTLIFPDLIKVTDGDTDAEQIAFELDMYCRGTLLLHSMDTEKS